MCFGGCLGLWLIKFRNNSTYKQVLRSCNVSEKESVFANIGTGFLVWRFFRSQKSTKISWNTKKKQDLKCLKMLVVNINLHFWRVTLKNYLFRPFDGWRLMPLRPSQHLSSGIHLLLLCFGVMFGYFLFAERVKLIRHFLQLYQLTYLAFWCSLTVHVTHPWWYWGTSSEMANDS